MARQEKKWTVECANIPSAIRPVQHADDLPVSQPSERYQLQVDEGGDSGREYLTSHDHDFVPESESGE